ncbi:serine hydrolase domain-containing protein [Hymenobacter sp.]|uniref:serine hydrolase domain-containing protein n=1 Tax=Hymenobacter sp. TaxID=1898978 RepID=UPI00286B2838|nr:serine hydrolase domain-containing protein [Hymenobacter sp.]
MIRLLFFALITLATNAFAQTKIANIIDAEYEAGHFNGAVLAVKNGQIVAQVNKGYANLQFAVPITPDTRFPVASMTKLFTAVLTLQLHEKGLLRLDDKAAAYVPGLPANCQDITITALLTHHSRLKNEPIEAYQVAYSTTEYVKKFVLKNESRKGSYFNYNNVDYVLLTRILETVSKKSFANLVRENIFRPLGMNDSGVVKESSVVPSLAYGYHNYSFGTGSRQDTLKNDSRKLSNYAGAGAVYSTVADLYKLLQALKANTLLSAKTTAAYLQKPQQAEFLEYARGRSTVGFYHNNKTFAKPVLERRGSIDGFNSVLLTNEEFTNAVLILTNTDTADLELIADKIYAEIE